MDTARTISQVSRLQRKIWIYVCLLTVFLFLAANGRTAYAAPARVSIVNQGIFNVRVTYGTMTSSAAAPEDWPATSPRQITYSGWYNIVPGETQEFPGNAWFYVEYGDKRFAWPGRTETLGVVRKSGAFDSVHVGYDNNTPPLPNSSDLELLVGRGFEMRTFQELPAGEYRISESVAAFPKTVSVSTGSGEQGAASGAGGTITLSAGLTADPHRVNVLAMGTRAASSLSGDCAGYIGSHPTARLNWSGESPELHIYVTSPVDTILLVKDPSGNYHCSDDWTTGSSMDPMLRFVHPIEGDYVIWVGKYDIGGTADALLYFSEQESLNPSNPQLFG
jgi:hypothetical protein